MRKYPDRKIILFRFRMTGILSLSIVLFLLYSCSRPKNISSVILGDKNNFYYINVTEYPKDRNSLPIGIFDSGTGGLSVLNDILNYEESNDSMCFMVRNAIDPHVFKQESFIFLADLANMPYGSYALENNTDLLVEHVLKDVQFMLGNKYYQSAGSGEYMEDKSPVKAIVIACNTATAYALDTIKNFIRKTGLIIGVIGVINAGAAGAISNFSPDEDGSIAVLATDGTVRSGAYVRTLESLKMESGLRGDISIFQQAGIGIAEAIDENKDFIDKSATLPQKGYKGPSDTGTVDMKIDMSLWDRYCFDMEGGAMLFEGGKENPRNIQINSVANYISFHLVSLMEKIRKTPNVKPLKSLILGCTHYPFFEETFRDVLMRLRNYRKDGNYIYRKFIDEDLKIINPADNLADQLYRFLGKQNLLNLSGPGKGEFFITLPNILNKEVKLREDGAFTYEYKYGRTVDDIQEYVKCVPFSRSSVAGDVLVRLSLQIPSVYEMIVNFTNNNPKTNFLKEEKRISR